MISFPRSGGVQETKGGFKPRVKDSFCARWLEASKSKRHPIEGRQRESGDYANVKRMGHSRG